MKTERGKLWMAFAILFVAVAFASIDSASASTIYVPDNYLTIQAAVNAANDGDTIIVRDGTYTEYIYANKRLTIRSENGAGSATIQPANPNDHIFNVIADYVNISGFTVTGATATGKAGIYLDGANHCNISYNNLLNNKYGIYLYDNYPGHSSNNKLIGNNASNNYAGIFIDLLNGHSNIITNNIVSNNADYGIRISSDNNVVSDNIVSDNDRYGIFLVYSDNNELIGNTVNYGSGIILSVSHNNKLTDNIVSNNDWGICLYRSGNNELTGNTMLYNDYNFGFLEDGTPPSSSLSDFINDIDTSNMVDGKPIYYLVDQQDQQIPNDAGYVGVINSTNITVKDLTLENNRQSVLFAYTSNSRIENVNVANNYYGIHLYHSDNNALTGNNASNNGWYDIFLLYSSNHNTLEENNANSNNVNGIGLEDSSNYNSITNNTISNSYRGILLQDSSNYNLLTNNTVSNNENGIILFSSNNNTLSGNTCSSQNKTYGYGISLLRYSSNNMLTDNTVNSNKDAGIRISGSGNNIITNNTASSNNYGIELSSSSNNNITNNIVNSNNEYGIFLESSSNNLIYNNYFNNVNNSYDDGDNLWNRTKKEGTNIIDGPYLGGNYWSDYAGVDTNLDGLGDTLLPYNSNGNITNGGDWLPLAQVGVTIYVPDHYTTIHEAVNAANEGDVIIVRDGSYNENVDVNKCLTIRSENGSASTTVTPSNPNDHVFEVTADYVSIIGFTVTGTSGGKGGIYLDTVDYCDISYNNASHNANGIYLDGSGNNTLSSNIVKYNTDNGIWLSFYSNNNELSDNIVNSNINYGIALYVSNNNNTLTNNDASNNNYGIHLSTYSNYNTVSSNTAINNSNYGISLYSSSSNIIYNNYFANTNNAYDNGNNIWNTTNRTGLNIIGGLYIGGNYWSDYAGNDTDGDGLGDTLRPYNSSGNIQQGGDWHPLVEVTISLPDLEITDTWVCWPDNCTICYNVTNIGSGTVTGGHNTSLLVDGIEKAYDFVAEPLMPNESYTGCFNYTWEYTPPEDNITVCADCNDTVTESNETNNCLNETWKCGDVNMDGNVDFLGDAIGVARHYMYGDPIRCEWAGDVDCSGDIDFLGDAIKIARHYMYGESLECCCN